MVQIVPLGSLTLLKRSGTLKNNVFEYKYYVELFWLAKIMAKTRFWGLGPGGIFFIQKRYSLGPEWVLSPKNLFWTPLDPPKGAILTHFTHEMAKMGFKNGLKRRFFEKLFLAPNHFISVPRWPGTLKNPKLAFQTPQWTPFWPILCAKRPNLGVENRVFLKYAFSYKMTFLGSSDHFSLGSKWFW